MSYEYIKQQNAALNNLFSMSFRKIYVYNCFQSHVLNTRGWIFDKNPGKT